MGESINRGGWSITTYTSTPYSILYCTTHHGGGSTVCTEYAVLLTSPSFLPQSSLLPFFFFFFRFFISAPLYTSIVYPSSTIIYLLRILNTHHHHHTLKKPRECSDLEKGAAVLLRLATSVESAHFHYLHLNGSCSTCCRFNSFLSPPLHVNCRMRGRLSNSILLRTPYMPWNTVEKSM